MDYNLFHHRLDFTDGLEQELKEALGSPQWQPQISWQEFWDECRKKQRTPRLLLPIAGQFENASALYQSAYRLAQEFYAAADIALDQSGAFSVTVHIELPISFCICVGPARDLLDAILHSDNFSIVPLGDASFDLVFSVDLYEALACPGHEKGQ